MTINPIEGQEIQLNLMSVAELMFDMEDKLTEFNNRKTEIINQNVWYFLDSPQRCV